MRERYNLHGLYGLKDGINRPPDGEEVFYISNPALGLWALRSQFGGGVLISPHATVVE